MTWAFQSESELLPIFNHNLYQMKQTGVIERLRQQFLGYNSDISTIKTIVDFDGLSYENVMLPFLALLIGICLALIQLGIETLVSKCSNDGQKLKEDTSEDEIEIIDDIYHLLLKNHVKLGGIKFLSKMRAISTLPNAHQ